MIVRPCWRSLFVFTIAAVAICFGQQTAGTVQGKITDTTGAVITGAELSLSNQETGISFAQTSGHAGTYVFNAVPPGLYRLTTKVPQFNTSVVSDIAVQLNSNTMVDVTLQPGEVMQSVEVQASAEVVDTQASVVKTNIPTRALVDLPSTSRNPLEMAEMAPGVEMNTGNLTGGSQMLGVQGTMANVSGGRQQQNTYYLDGSDNSGALRNSGLQMPNVEAIAEVQVVTSTNSAEFGKQPGGYFNVITKSGTNDFRGSAFYFGRNEVLNANSWVNNRNGLARVPDNRRLWGGTFGGPIVENKTFFFGSYQRYTDRATQTNQNTRFSTVSMLNGDFSQFTGQLYNPDTGAPIPGNNLAAVGLVNPVAQRWMKDILPTVQNLGERYVWQFEVEPRSNEFLGKVDHNFNSAHRLSGSFFGTKGETNGRNGSTPNYLYNTTSANQQTASVRHTWIRGSNQIFEFQAARARHVSFMSVPDEFTGKTLADYGAVLPQAIEGGRKFMPGFQISDGPNGEQPGGVAGDYRQDNTRAGGTMAWIKSRHNAKFGFEGQRSQVGLVDDTDKLLFRFQGRMSNRNRAAVTNYAPNALFVHSMADMLMGRYNDMSVNGLLDFSLSAWSYYAFAQDQWRVTPKFTLNYGLRYEFYLPYKEENNKMSAFVAGHQSDRFPNAPFHIAFAGDRGVPQGFINLSKTNFAPRLGLAYDIFGNGKLAIRAGAGTYYAFPGAQIATFGSMEFPQRPNIQAQEGNLSNPWMTSVAPVFRQQPVPFPSDHDEYLRNYEFVPPFARIIGFSPDFKTPRSYQWNFQVEGEIRSGWTATAAYVGNRGRAQLQAIPFNYARFRPTPTGQAPSLDINNIIARTAYPEHSRFSLMVESSGNSVYDGMQLSTSIRWKNLLLRPWYEYSASFGDGGGTAGAIDEDPSVFTSQTNNPANPRGEWGRRSRLQSFRAFWVYDLPVLRNAGSWVGTIFGGWQYSGNIGIFSGPPLDVILGYDANFDGITASPQDRPDLIKPISYTEGSEQQRMVRYFDPGSFARPAINANYLFGNLQRNAVWGPGNWTVSSAMLKNFRFAERYTMQVRMEAYNLLNHPNLNNPNTNMSSGDFSRILQKSGNRSMQYGLRFSF